MTMSSVDLVSLVAFGIPEWTGEGLNLVTNDGLMFKPENISTIFCKTLRYIWHWSIFASYWILVALSIERYVAISNPFLARQFIKIRSAKIICGTIVILALFLFSPLIFVNIYVLYGEENMSLEKRHCFLSGETPHQIYFVSVVFGLTFTLPPLLLIITCSILIRKLVILSKERMKFRILPLKRVKVIEIRNAMDLLVISFVTLIIASLTLFWIPTLITVCKSNYFS